MSNRRFLTYSLVIAGSQYSLNIEINILRFEDAYVDVNKAMILPKIASPHLNIVNPAAGMMYMIPQKNSWPFITELCGAFGNHKRIDKKQ
ncbi:hypothetical protein KYG33_00915 [Chryseobacterium sp. D764]|jgi:hypothetical protein|uniref:hypothetical protein n=1 Tax=unclassified Chryseobacterium TaxID=2593645 RepID=UPI00158EFD74|nr:MULTISPECIES: hypothetical protein [unclassified Chryseobacterium]QXU51722.1 hypothetical protein KYG33_00915 [Chryseobacterium sp. D764]